MYTTLRNRALILAFAMGSTLGLGGCGSDALRGVSWTEIEFCGVKFPGEPTKAQSNARTAFGTVRETRHTLMTETGTYELHWWKMPLDVDMSSDPSPLFDKVRDICAKGVGPVKVDEELDHGGVTGRLVKIQSPRGYWRAARMFLHDEWYYQLTFTGKKETLDGPVVQEFFESLRLGAAAPGR